MPHPEVLMSLGPRCAGPLVQAPGCWSTGPGSSPLCLQQVRNYTDCGCVQSRQVITPSSGGPVNQLQLVIVKTYLNENGFALSGKCDRTCNTLIPFLIFLFIVTLITACAQPSAIIVTLRFGSAPIWLLPTLAPPLFGPSAKCCRIYIYISISTTVCLCIKGCISDSRPKHTHPIYLIFPHDPLASCPISRASKKHVSVPVCACEKPHNTRPLSVIGWNTSASGSGGKIR